MRPSRSGRCESGRTTPWRRSTSAIARHRSCGRAWAVREGTFDYDELSADEKLAFKERLFRDILPLESLEIESRNALADELRDFVDTIRTARAPRVDARAGRDAVAVAEAVLDSLRTHRRAAAGSELSAPRIDTPLPNILRPPHWQPQVPTPRPAIARRVERRKSPRAACRSHGSVIRSDPFFAPACELPRRSRTALPPHPARRHGPTSGPSPAKGRGVLRGQSRIGGPEKGSEDWNEPWRRMTGNSKRTLCVPSLACAVGLVCAGPGAAHRLTPNRGLRTLPGPRAWRSRCRAAQYRAAMPR